MGQVWRACRAVLDEGSKEWEELAIKVLLPARDDADQRKSLERFEREARCSLEVRHRAFVRVHEFGRHEEEGQVYPYLAMELVPGCNLFERVEGSPPLEEPELCHLGSEVAAALTAIHAVGICHRDVTPKNVMWTEDDRAMLIDLGLGLELGSSQRLTTHGVIGTRAYMAPEHLLNNECVLASDLYSLGATLYFAASGRPPHVTENEAELMDRHVRRRLPRSLAELRPDLSDFFTSCVHALLEHEPSDRLGPADVLAATLQAGERSRWWTSSIERRERRGAAAALQRLRPVADEAFVGRDHELERLRQELGAAESGEGRCVVVEGEAGAGKTALVTRMLEELRQRTELSVLHGRALDVREGSPGSAFAEGLREWLAGEDPDRVLRRQGLQSSEVGAALRSVLRGDGDSAIGQGSSVEPLRAGVATFAKALCSRERVVWVAEDLHAGSTLDRIVLETLLPLVPNLRLLLVLTTRPEPRDPRMRELLSGSACRRLVPGPLTRDEVEQLLTERAERAGFPRPPAHVVSAVHGRTGGHPLFAAALAREFVGRWPEEDEGAELSLPLPRSLSELIEAKLDALDDEDAWLLRLAAVAGASFDAEALAELVGRPVLAVLRSLSRIGRSKGLVRAEGRRHRFEHELVREALLERMDEPLKYECHSEFARQAERALAEADGGWRSQTGELRAEAARHWLAAGQFESAAPHLGEALDHHERHFEHEALSWLAGRALELAPPSFGASRACRLELRRATSLLYLERRAAAGRALERAVEAARSDGAPGLRALALRRRAQVFQAPGRHAQAVRILEEAARLAEDCGEPDLRIEIAADLVHAAGRAGSRERAREVRASALAVEGGSALARARLLGAAGLLHYRDEEHAEARRSLLEALELAREAGSKSLEAYALSSLHLVEHALGWTEDAVEHCMAHARLCAEIGFRSGEARACLNLGTLALGRGETQAAERYYQRQVELARELGSDEIAAGWLGLASAALWSGQLKSARGGLEAALDGYERMKSATGAADILLVRAQLEWTEGRLRAAESTLDDAVGRARAAGSRRHETTALAWQARLAHAAGRPEKAVDLARAACRAAEEVAAPAVVAVAEAALGRCLVERQPGLAVRAFRRAAELASRHALLDPGPVAEAWLSLLKEADPDEITVDAGCPALIRMEAWYVLHRASARDGALQRAFDVACRLASHLTGGDLERFLRANPLVRRIVEEKEALEA